MNDKKLLIAGIDPGITAAYAILDIEGKLIKAYSSKNLDLNHLISEIIKIGKVILVGTDKHKTPSLVEAYAAKLGARIANPDEDLKVDEKRKMILGFNIEDDHQADALASALFAYRSVKPLLEKIDSFAEKNSRQEIKDRIKEIVVTKKISIKSAASMIEKKEEEDQIIERVVVEKKLREADFLKLYDGLKKAKSEIKLLKNYKNNLENKLTKITNQETRKERDNSRIYDFREGRLRFLENIVRTKNQEIEKLISLIRKFNKVLSGINDFYILKKLDSFGASEFKLKNKLLAIRKNDMLLVDNPNIISSEVIDSLRDKIFIIVCKIPVNRKIENSLPFVFIDAKNLRIEEDRYFGFVEKKQFEAEKDKVGWVKKIIEDYRREKELLR